MQGATVETTVQGAIVENKAQGSIAWPKVRSTLIEPKVQRLPAGAAGRAGPRRVPTARSDRKPGSVLAAAVHATFVLVAEASPNERVVAVSAACMPRVELDRGC